MRTTITLDDDVVTLVERAMRERRGTFRQTVNEALRSALGRGRHPTHFRQRTYPMGDPIVPVTKALALAADLEDEDILRELTTGR